MKTKRKSSIQRKITFSIGILIALSIITNVTSVFLQRKTIDSANKITGEYVQDLSDVNAFYRDILVVDGKLQRHIFADLKEAQEILENQLLETKTEADTLLETIQAIDINSSLSEQIQQLATLYAQYIEGVNQCLKMSDEGKQTEAVALSLDSVSHNFDDIVAILQQVNIDVEKLAETEKDKLDTASSDSMTAANVTIVQVFIVGTLVIFYNMKSVIKPLKKAQKALNNISRQIEEEQGDLTVRIKKEKSDEVGELIDGINSFMDILQNIIKEVYNVSNGLSRSSDELQKHVESISDEIGSSSATMEEMSASMMETSSTVEKIAGTTHDIEQTAEKMSSMATEGVNYALDIDKKASEWKNNAVDAQNTMKTMIADISEQLSTAIEEAKAVERITGLTTAILDIASQTNLLSLNASIEAARAGDQGKGFAVVADEIRKLADDSTGTANQIQEISSTVINTVAGISGSAQELLNFMNKNVANDYDILVTMGEQYSNDAENFVKSFESFNSEAGRILDAMRDENKKIEAISEMVEQCSGGIQDKYY